MNPPSALALPEILATLNNPELELDWDSAWDELMSVDPHTTGLVDKLLKTLSSETDFARLAALVKLSRIGAQTAIPPQTLEQLLHDDSASVRLEALRTTRLSIRQVPGNRALLKKAVMNTSEHVGIRFRAAYYMLFG